MNSLICIFIWLTQVSLAGTIKENIRLGVLESEKSDSSMWDEFLSSDENPEAVLGSVVPENLRAWIGSSSSVPGFQAKQTFKAKNLVLGKLYVLRLYPAYSSVSTQNWVAKVVGGSADLLNSDNTNQKFAAFPLGNEASGTAWNVTFIAHTEEVTFEFSGIQNSGEVYLFVDAWELIDLSTPIPSKMFTLTSKSGPKLLGKSRSGPTRYSPKWKIRYKDYRFNCPENLKLREERLSVVNKAVAFAYSRGVPFREIDSFFQVAIQTILGKEQIGKWIDLSFDEVRNKWLACGGGYANATNYSVPSRLFVTIKPALWWNTGGNFTGYIAGLSRWPSQQVYSVNAAFDGLMSNPTQALFYTNVRTITAWEFGNQLGQASGYFPGYSTASEIGNQSPCGR